MAALHVSVDSDAVEYAVGAADRPVRNALYWERRYRHAVMVADGIVALAAGCLAFLSRFGDMAVTNRQYLIASLLLPVGWIAAVLIARAYETRFLFVGPDEYQRILLAGISLIAGVAVVSYAADLQIARGYVVVALPGVTLGTLAMRYAARKRLHRRRTARGRNMRNVLLVGHESTVAALARRLGRERYHGMQVVGACVPRPVPTQDGEVQIYGSFDDVDLAVQVSGADTVAVLACPEFDGDALRRLAWQLEKDDVDLVVAPALMDVAGPRTTIRPVDGLPLLHVEHPDLSGGRRLVKALFDRFGAALILLVAAPLFIGIAVAIRLGGGPALFAQERVGRGGRPFRLYKFRSMYPDAEQSQAALADANEFDGVLFKMRDDPRVTALGRWLRRYSLDELPQLFNVLLGQMSLVGPRPPLPAEVAQYAADVRRRLVVKPGITGLWQVSGRSDLSWDESVRLDLRYVENWSLAMDLLILWRTVFAVAKSSGAY